MRRLYLAALSLAAMPLAAMLVFGPAALAANDKCQPQLAEALAEKGVPWNTLQDPEWEAETQSDKRGQEVIAGYQFFARPQACAEGELFARLDQDCRITQIYTRRGCKAGSVRAR